MAKRETTPEEKAKDAARKRAKRAAAKQDAFSAPRKMETAFAEMKGIDMEEHLRKSGIPPVGGEDGIESIPEVDAGMAKAELELLKTQRRELSKRTNAARKAKTISDEESKELSRQWRALSKQIHDLGGKQERRKQNPTSNSAVGS